MTDEILIKRRKSLEKYLKNTAEDLPDKIREYSQNQKELWRQVPYLALEADLRGSPRQDCQRAYSRGLWEVRNTDLSDYVNTYVNLETGELVNENFRPLKNEEVLSLVFYFDSLNAQKLINRLEKEAKEGYPGYQKPEEVGKERERIRKLYGITKIYTRKK